jgi:hypothetical protein
MRMSDATPPGPQTSAICGTSLPKFSPAKSMRSVSGKIAKPATISSRDFVAEREHMRRRTFEGVENVLVIWFHRPRAPNGITRKPGRDHRTSERKPCGERWTPQGAPRDLSGWSATTKLEKLAVSARHPFQEAMERVGQFRRRRHVISRSLCETDDPRRDPHAWSKPHSFLARITS